MSYKRLLLAATIIPFVVCCAFIMLFNWFTSMARAQSDYELLLLQNAKRQVLTVESDLKIAEQLLANGISMLGKKLTAEDIRNLTFEEIDAYLAAVVKTRAITFAACMAMDAGWRGENSKKTLRMAARANPSDPDSRIDITDMSTTDFDKEGWFLNAKQAGKGIWNEPYLYSGFDEWIFSYSLPIIINGRFYGVIAIAALVEEYNKQLKAAAAELGDGVYCVIVNGKGEYLMHPDLYRVRSHRNLFINNLDVSDPAEWKKAEALHSTRELGLIRKVRTHYAADKEDLYGIIAPLDINDWSLAVFLPEKNFLGPIRRQMLYGLIIMLLITMFLIGVSVVSIHLFTAPLRDVVATAEAIGAGKPDPVIKKQRFVEFATLADAFNRMIEAIRMRTEQMELSIRNLDQVLEQVTILMRDLTQVAGEMSERSQELSSGAIEQESVFSEISQATEQLKNHADSNAGMAKETNDIITRVESMALDGGVQIRNLSEAMTAISESSKTINSALKAIDTIAFQTNILALNAAVEAARAGSHGKGFNVVASEVRQLANRSAQSVVTTSQILKESDDKIGVGVTLGRKTSESFSDIESVATQAANLMRQVTTQAREQSAILAEVVTGIGQVADIARKNVLTASANASVSEEILAISSRMRGVLNDYSVRSGDTTKIIRNKDVAPGWRDFCLPRTYGTMQ